ncbi:uncharacterized protein BO97DRAFT_476120 [Aspergillus homomorphus CBS 101889]|uniref:Aromatic prenyltransferase n=1 Tax=Aspergillus homomorphus (strain CBS 101889) TaxID=1450537 RepID=A0A395I578_ASPHC|nr:hypothetical protein BO97DRAFT_476120 [Aspergillus homomorphus CBS 101889]RAL15147.1 hypothetical protein BO97DRAFT_476120 [Aspergillus homomorphus CBS 101889]
MALLQQNTPSTLAGAPGHQSNFAPQRIPPTVQQPLISASAPASAPSYISEATRQLTRLSKAVGQDEIKREKLLHALRSAGAEWARKPIPLSLDRSAWVSDVSNDHSPYEYSLALSQQTGASELRFLIEAQPEQNSLAALQESTSRLTDEIMTQYGPEKVSVDRLNLVRDLFLPADAEGRLAAWHSFATSNTLEKWKIYLNPVAAGMQNACRVIRQALERLGLAHSWALLETILTDNDCPIYFSLGLSPNPEDAEVKVYVAHFGASATQIAHKHVQMDRQASIPAIEQFYLAMGGGSLGPYRRKPGLSCFHFKNRDPSRPAARTVLYPMDSYAVNDADAQQRVETYMDAISAPQLYRERYRSAIRAVQRRPLEAGRGIHSWVSMKEKPDGTRSNTFYLSAELFGCLGDDSLATYSVDESL